jgi:hypothetical protein
MACKKKPVKINLFTCDKVVRRLMLLAKCDQRAVRTALRPLLNHDRAVIRRRASWAIAAVERQLDQIDAGGGMAIEKNVFTIRRHLLAIYKAAKGDKRLETQLQKIELAFGGTAYFSVVLCVGKVGRAPFVTGDDMMPIIVAILADKEKTRKKLSELLCQSEIPSSDLEWARQNVEAFLNTLRRLR